MEFDWIRESSGISEVPKVATESPTARSKAPAIMLAVGLLALAVAIAVAFLYRSQNAPAERLEFSIPLQEEMSHLALSPDGRMLAFVTPDQASGANMLGVQRIGSPGVSIVPGTQGASYPFWSPDDAYVAFFADGKLKKVAVSGGAPQALATATSGRGGSWSRRGVIVFSPQASGWLWKVNADGSNVAPLTDKIFDATKIVSHRWPVFLPDAEHFLFVAETFTIATDNSARGIFLGSLTGEAKKITSLARSNPGY